MLSCSECYVMISCVKLCCVMLCYFMLFYAMLCYVMLCYHIVSVMLWHVEGVPRQHPCKWGRVDQQPAMVRPCTVRSCQPAVVARRSFVALRCAGLRCVIIRHRLTDSESHHGLNHCSSALTIALKPMDSSTTVNHHHHLQLCMVNSNPID